ncbi:MAG: histidine phosphatase family protein [Patescibacteria group bacterium]|nr:histidine phosphatase family protein [Patescibacteria group bacterium]
MMKIIFEAHSTTKDNEKELASGWNDVELSKLGLKQAKELGVRYKNNCPKAVFTSDLKRAYYTAKIAFANKIDIIKDKRLREIDYGELTHRQTSEIIKEKPKYIDNPFPKGQSYQETSKNMVKFLTEIEKNYHNQTIMIIGHRATQYALEHIINKIPLNKAITAPWQWQPGWTYIYK